MSEWESVLALLRDHRNMPDTLNLCHITHEHVSECPSLPLAMRLLSPSVSPSIDFSLFLASSSFGVDWYVFIWLGTGGSSTHVARLTYDQST